MDHHIATTTTPGAETHAGPTDTNREERDALSAPGHVAGTIDQADSSLAAKIVNLHLNLGSALLARGELADAAASFQWILSVQPTHWVARLKLAHVLKLSKNYDAALAILQTLAAEYPDNPIVYKEFGRVYFARQQLADALESFQRVLRLKPDDADTHHWLADIEHLLGNEVASQEHFQLAVALNPLLRVPAIKTPADFSVLLLFARGTANTPPTALIRMADYDSYFLLLLANVEYDIPHLQQQASVVFNLISDVDMGREILSVAETLVDRLGLPVVNAPRKVMQTDRESVATRLSGIRFCRVPRVRYYAGHALGAADQADLLDRHALPFLARVAGSHGGHDFERMENLSALNDFVARHPEANFYLTEYIDYQSADGFFRKYRFFFVGDEILPYHLAIDNKWKVHHYTTEMATQPWMQREEEAFLNDPGSVFQTRQFSTLRAIQRTIGLDYFGIDCALDREGNIVVFEVNASMLVHRDNGAFAYKTPHIDRIKKAFDAMLRKLALGSTEQGG